MFVDPTSVIKYCCIFVHYKITLNMGKFRRNGTEAVGIDTYKKIMRCRTKKQTKNGEEINVKMNEVNNISIKEHGILLPDRFRMNHLVERNRERCFQIKMEKHRTERLRKANIEEDKFIRKLEKQLRIDKRKNDESIHAMFKDGLDYALEFCFPSNLRKKNEEAKDIKKSCQDVNNTMLTNIPSTGNIELQKLKKPMTALSKAQVKSFNCGMEFQALDTKLSSDASYKIDASFDDDSEWSNAEAANKLLDNHIQDRKGSLDTFTIEQEASEDTTGRKQDIRNNFIEVPSIKYTTPQIRANFQIAASNEKFATLQRHCKGYLNRLSETNIHKIASDIERLYSINSRFDVTSTLWELINETIVKYVMMPERMILEYAMLIAVLHANIGSEIGAQFLENLIWKIVRFLQNIEILEVENKKLDNALLFLCSMYTFKIFHHSLIYDVLTRLNGKLCEKSVDCILHVLRTIGFQLRKNDPIALMDLIHMVQENVKASSYEVKENSRLKFLLKVLFAIKNNNMAVIPHYDPSLTKHMENVFSSTIMKRKNITTLNISIEDVISAHQKGKWWVIGSAWTGNLHEKKQGQIVRKRTNEKYSKQLLTLAKQHRMNTRNRKNIFCIIMSAEDYVNAFDRLLRLSIKDQKMIAAIIIHCCLSEKTFNQYYGALAQKFCEYERKFQLGMRYALWDRIKKIQYASAQSNKNLANLLMRLINKGSQPLSVLKVIEFEEMNKVTLRFLRQIMLGIFLSPDNEYRNVFARVATSKKLGLFKDSLRLLMHHFLLKAARNKVCPEKWELLQNRINCADELLQMKGSKIKLCH